VPKKPHLQLTEKHQISLSEIVDQTSTVVAFGKVIKDLQPTSQGHHFGQVFGYKQNGVCSKLPNTIIIALPEPDGRADDCGWDPEQFVKWELPASFASTQLHVRPVVILDALFASAAGSTGAHPSTAQADQIVLNSCKPEHPNATLNNTVGGLFPLPKERNIFVSRVVANTRSAGFTIAAGKIPIGDTDTLGTVAAAVVTNATS
jgi:hypothetical protein